MIRYTYGLFCVVLLAGATKARSVLADDAFPSHPITIIQPGPPGGGTDTLARALAAILEPAVGRRVIVENRPGAGGVVGMNAIVQARPDGYTIGYVHNGPLTTIPATRKVPYTPDSYAPLVQTGYGSYVMCVSPDFPAANAREFLSVLKASPGKYTYGNDGVGSTMQLAAERIFHHEGVKATAVPFGGAGETARNFLGGHVDIYGGSLPPMLPQVAAGKAKCLLLTSSADNPSMPGAAGLKSLGMGELDTGLWWGLIAPNGVPESVRAYLVDAITKAAQSDQFRENLKRLGADPEIRGPDAFRELIVTEAADLAAVVRDVGLVKE